MPLTLCEADCTRHGPTLNGGAGATAGSDAGDDPDGVGVAVLLLFEADPIVYDWEILVRPKKEFAAANITQSCSVDRYEVICTR